MRYEKDNSTLNSEDDDDNDGDYGDNDNSTSKSGVAILVNIGSSTSGVNYDESANGSETGANVPFY